MEPEELKRFMPKGTTTESASWYIDNGAKTLALTNQLEAARHPNDLVNLITSLSEDDLRACLFHYVIWAQVFPEDA